MNWNEKCLLELTHRNMFDSTDHRNRFRDLLDCYFSAPFFCKGLCKCMYLSAWDDDHFNDMLDMLNHLTIEGARNLRSMSDHGSYMFEELDGADAEIYKLSTSFIANTPYDLPDFTLMDAETAHIIRQALLASFYIDDLPDPKHIGY